MPQDLADLGQGRAGCLHRRRGEIAELMGPHPVQPGAAGGPGHRVPDAVTGQAAVRCDAADEQPAVKRGCRAARPAGRR